jgi:hypothetical protein
LAHGEGPLSSVQAPILKKKKKKVKSSFVARHQWLAPVILATQEAEISRFEVTPGK